MNMFLIFTGTLCEKRNLVSLISVFPMPNRILGLDSDQQTLVEWLKGYKRNETKMAALANDCIHHLPQPLPQPPSITTRKLVE